MGLVTHFNSFFAWAQLGAFLIHSFCIVFPSMQRLQATHAQNAAIFIFRTSSMGSPVAKWPRQLHKEHVLSAGCYAHVRSGSGGSKRTTVGGRGVESSHYIHVIYIHIWISMLVISLLRLLSSPSVTASPQWSGSVNREASHRVEGT